MSIAKLKIKYIFLVAILVLFPFYQPVITKAAGEDCSFNSSSVKPECECVRDPKSASCASFCKDTDNSKFTQYNSVACSKIRLGLVNIDTSEVLIKTDPESFVVTLSKWLMVVITIGFVVKMVIEAAKIGLSKQEGNKSIGEGWTRLARVALAYIVVLTVPGLVFVLGSAFGNGANGNILPECQDLIDRGAEQSVIDQCLELEG